MIIPIMEEHNILKNGLKTVYLQQNIRQMDVNKLDTKKILKIVKSMDGYAYDETIFSKIINIIIKYQMFYYQKVQPVNQDIYNKILDAIRKTDRINYIIGIIDKVKKYNSSSNKYKRYNKMTIDCSSYLVNYVNNITNSKIVYETVNTGFIKQNNTPVITASEEMSYDIFLHYYISYNYNFFESNSIAYLYTMIKSSNEQFIENTIRQLVLNAILNNRLISNNDIQNLINSEINNQNIVEIIGQDKQIKEVEELLDIRSIVRLNANKPEAILLFVGQTGVGKTELAKQIAEEYKGGRYTLLQMETFAFEHSVTNLFGSPLSYVGSDKDPMLLADMKQDPSRVIIFDEIEKAHSNIYQVLIGLMDTGMATFNGIQKISFKNTILIFTSNVITKVSSLKSIGFNLIEESQTTKQSEITDILASKFKPEFLGRIDKFILFNDISDKETALRIIKSKLKKIGLEFTPDDYEQIYNNSKEAMKRFGVRAINNSIEKYIANKLQKQRNKE